MSQKKQYLCIHGHFYQPPRENPWLEQIEAQESAAPFHDWNERIYDECYLPAATARVLDSRGHILNIVNNFEAMNFNLGPTLLSWLEEKHPETYRLVIEADRQSCKRFGGHGNAIAQAYNHIIMPLASERDKETQVIWGIEDFRRRFHRDPESMWLPETACNEDTLEVLIKHGMKYLILSPYQAEATRPIFSEEWTDVSSGDIDPRQPYRCFLKRDPERYIDIFFYDGPVSQEVGFGDLLFDAKRFMDRIEEAKSDDEANPQLIHLATDGETYGHHKAYGERALAYLLYVEAPKRGYHVTNYGEYLEKFPPQFAVRLKDGDGDGSSWSCSHGVKRWKEHCGCQTGGEADWTQHWRAPLRAALDWLNGELARIFESQGQAYFQDVWAARNDYIHVVLDRSEASVQDFFDKHAQRPLERDEVIHCLRLLEMQRQSMLMYTSCGWFFTEISGIETVQILRYAARAIQLAMETNEESLEEEFLNLLSKAKSNIAYYQDGYGLYRKLVKPSVLTTENIVALYAIGSTLEAFLKVSPVINLYAHRIETLHHRKEIFGDLSLNFGRIRIRSDITLEEQDFVFMVVQIGLYDFRCSLKSFRNAVEVSDIEKQFFEDIHQLHIIELLRKMDAYFGEKYYALKDMPIEERKRMIAILTKEAMEKINAVHENLYDENRRMSEIYRSINLPIPSEIRYAVQHTLSRRLLLTIKEITRLDFNLKKARPIYRMIEEARSFGIELETIEANTFLSNELAHRVKRIIQNPKADDITACLHLSRLTNRIGLTLDLRGAQDNLFLLLKKWRDNTPENFQLSKEAWEALLRLSTILGIQSDVFKKSSLKEFVTT